MSDKPLFQNADELEKRYAGEHPDRVAADEQGSLSPPQSDEGDTPVAVPIGTGGSIAATPPSDAFELGMEREEDDIRRGNEGYVGPDLRDEQADRS